MAVQAQRAALARRVPGGHGRHRPGAARPEADHRRRDRQPRQAARPLGHRPGRRRGRGLRPDVSAPLLRRAARARRAARPAGRYVPLDHAARRPPPGRVEHRPGGGPRHQRPPAHPGPAVHAARHDRERPAVPALPRRHAHAVAAAHPGRTRRRARPVVHRRPLPQAALPGHLVRPGPGRGRRRDRGRLGHRCAGGQGLRPGAAGDGEAGDGQPPALRGPAAHRPAQRPLHPRPPGRALARPGRHAGPRRLDGHPRPDHPGHLRRLLDVPRPAHRPGPDAHHDADRRPAGPRRRRAGPRTHRHPPHPGRGHQDPAAGRPGHRRLRQRHLRLQQGAAGPGRVRPDRRARRDGRRRRLLRLRQVHRLPAGARASTT